MFVTKNNLLIVYKHLHETSRQTLPAIVVLESKQKSYKYLVKDLTINVYFEKRMSDEVEAGFKDLPWIIDQCLGRSAGTEDLSYQ